MRKEEVHQEFIFKLLDIVSACDEEIQAAYEKRNSALVELNEWLSKTFKEA